MLVNKLNLTSNEDDYFTEDDFESSPEPFQNKISPQEEIILPFSLPEINFLRASDQGDNYVSKIVTADLEAIIDPNGNNYVYMAAWYNGSQHPYNPINKKRFSINQK